MSQDPPVFDVADGRPGSGTIYTGCPVPGCGRSTRS
jgi:hypothetical protein